jgi:hypothetical protein
MMNWTSVWILLVVTLCQLSFFSASDLRLKAGWF